MQLGVISFFVRKKNTLQVIFVLSSCRFLFAVVVFVVVFLLLFVYSFVETLVRFLACRFALMMGDFFLVIKMSFYPRMASRWVPWRHRL